MAKRTLTLDIIERYQSMSCSGWGFVIANWPELLCSTESGQNENVSIRSGPGSNGRMWPGRMYHIFTSCDVASGCTRIQGKNQHLKAVWCSGQWSAGSWHLYGCYSDTYHIPKPAQVHPVMKVIFHNDSVLFQQDSAPQSACGMCCTNYRDKLRPRPLTGSAAKVLVPNTTRHLQTWRSCWVLMSWFNEVTDHSLYIDYYL